MAKIVNLEITLQSRVSSKARKNVVRKDNLDGPYRNRKIQIPVEIDIGPDSGANLIVRSRVVKALRSHAGKGEILFYVTAEFEGSAQPGKSPERYFKTIIPRSEVPVSFRRV